MAATAFARRFIPPLVAVATAVLVLGPMTAPAVAGPDGWSDPVTVASTDDGLYSHDLASSADGRIVVSVWRSTPPVAPGGAGAQDVLDTARIWSAVSRDHGGTWSAPVALFDGPDHVAGDPRVAVSATGQRVAIVWDQTRIQDSNAVDPVVRVLLSADAGATYSASDITPGAEGMSGWGMARPRVGMSADGGRMAVTWIGSGSQGLFARRSGDGGANWSATTTVRSPDHLVWDNDLAASTDGMRLHSVWYEADTDVTEYYNVRAASSSDGGATFTAPWTMHTPATPTSSAQLPRVASSADGMRAVVAYPVSGNNAYAVLMAHSTTDGGTSWGPQIPLETGTGASAWFPAPSVDMNAAGGTATVAWGYLSEELGPRSAVEVPPGWAVQVASTTNSGASWSAPQNLVTGLPGPPTPDVSVSAAGSAQAVIWAQPQAAAATVCGSVTVQCLPNDPGDVLTRRSLDSGSSWGAPATIGSGPNAGAIPLLAGAADLSRIVASWIQGQVQVLGESHSAESTPTQPGKMLAARNPATDPVIPSPTPTPNPPAPKPTPTPAPTPQGPPDSPRWGVYSPQTVSPQTVVSLSTAAPRAHGRTLVRWAKAKGATSYRVSAGGGLTCRVPAKKRQCTLNRALGKRAKVHVRAVGPGGVSAPRRAKYRGPGAKIAGTVNFPPDSARLTSKQKSQIRALAARLARSGFTEVSLDGFTATVAHPGSDTFRHSLSKRRAAAVRSQMRAKWHRMGVHLTVSIRANGGSDPVGNNDTEQGRSKNRRATVLVR